MLQASSPASPLKIQSPHPEPAAQAGTTSQLTTQQGLGTCKGHRTPATLTRTSPAISGGVFKLQHCFLTEHPHQPPARRALWGIWGRHHPVLQLENTIYFGSLPKVNLTTQVSLVSSISSHCTSWTYALRRPPVELKKSTPYRLASQWPEPGSYQWGHWVPWPTVNMHTSKLLSYWLGVPPLTQVNNLAISWKTLCYKP